MIDRLHGNRKTYPGLPPILHLTLDSAYLDRHCPSKVFDIDIAIAIPAHRDFSKSFLPERKPS